MKIVSAVAAGAEEFGSALLIVAAWLAIRPVLDSHAPRAVDTKYLDQIRAQAEQFSTKLLSRLSSIAECAIRNFKNGKNVIKPLTLRKLTKAIRGLQNQETLGRL